MNLTVQLKLQPTKEQDQWLTTNSNSVSGMAPSAGRCGNKYNYSLIAISLDARL